MTMQASGPITFAQVQTEHGGANPISISEYYRNGAYVTGNNTSVPTSGAISLSNFYLSEKLSEVVLFSRNLNFVPADLSTYGFGLETNGYVVSGKIYAYNDTGINFGVSIQMYPSALAGFDASRSVRCQVTTGAADFNQQPRLQGIDGDSGNGVVYGATIGAYASTEITLAADNYTSLYYWHGASVIPHTDGFQLQKLIITHPAGA